METRPAFPTGTRVTVVPLTQAGKTPCNGSEDSDPQLHWVRKELEVPEGTSKGRG